MCFTRRPIERPNRPTRRRKRSNALTRPRRPRRDTPDDRSPGPRPLAAVLGTFRYGLGLGVSGIVTQHQTTRLDDRTLHVRDSEESRLHDGGNTHPRPSHPTQLEPRSLVGRVTWAQGATPGSSPERGSIPWRHKRQLNLILARCTLRSARPSQAALQQLLTLGHIAPAILQQHHHAVERHGERRRESCRDRTLHVRDSEHDGGNTHPRPSHPTQLEPRSLVGRVTWAQGATPGSSPERGSIPWRHKRQLNLILARCTLRSARPSQAALQQLLTLGHIAPAILQQHHHAVERHGERRRAGRYEAAGLGLGD